jgi:hypothetical protein
VVEHGRARGARIVDEEQVAGQRGVLIGDAQGADRSVEQGGRVGERLLGGPGEPCRLGVGGGILAAVEVGGPVVVGRAQQRLPGADPVTGGQRVPPDALDARRRRGPLGRPGLLVALRYLAAGNQDLAESGAAVVGVARSAQRLEGEGLVVVEEFYLWLPSSWNGTVTFHL